MTFPDLYCKIFSYNIFSFSQKKKLLPSLLPSKRLSNKKLSLEKLLTARVKLNKGYCKMKALLNTEHFKYFNEFLF